MVFFRSNVLVSIDPVCIEKDAYSLMGSLQDELVKQDLVDEVQVLDTSLIGNPKTESPDLIVDPEAVHYTNLSVEDVPFLVEEHFLKDNADEGNPHSVIEGMIIGAYAAGSSQGYINCHAKYPISVQTMKTAINQARSFGLLGENIMGTDFLFDLEVRIGAGAFVCGEETALMTSIERTRGKPKLLTLMYASSTASVNSYAPMTS